MTSVVTKDQLSDFFDRDLTWRRQELSDLKSEINNADSASRRALLRALIPMLYAHWEGYVRQCSKRYFEFITARRMKFDQLNRQFYINRYLTRIDVSSRNRMNIEDRCILIEQILDGMTDRFSRIDQNLIDTKSNLNCDVVSEICKICDVDAHQFEDKREFIDKILLKRRNSIAHGQNEFVDFSDMDELVRETLALMSAFRTLLENKIVLDEYLG